MQRMRLHSALLLASTAAAWLSGPASALDATPNDKSAPANTGNGPVELEEIVVTGLRASLERSLDTKRDAAVTNAVYDLFIGKDKLYTADAAV